MKNLSEMRLAAVEQLEKIKTGKYEKDDIDSFCKVCNLILSSLTVEISYKTKIDSNRRIDYIEINPEQKLLR